MDEGQLAEKAPLAERIPEVATKRPNWGLRLLLAVLAVTVLVTLLAHYRCSLEAENPAATPTDMDPVDSSYVSPYDPEQLLLDGKGRWGYWRDGQLVSRDGVDVSYHQGQIDWAKVAADDISFAFIRLGYRGSSAGDVYLDEQFEANYTGATAAGLDVGVYFYSQALDEDEARAEADFVLAALAGRPLQYPVAYDFETTVAGDGRADWIDQHQRTNNTLAFCQRIREGGYQAMVYGNNRDINASYYEVIKAYDIWFAEYGVDFPSAQFDIKIWQYSNSGQVAGIPKAVDLNLEFVAE